MVTKESNHIPLLAYLGDQPPKLQSASSLTEKYCQCISELEDHFLLYINSLHFLQKRQFPVTKFGIDLFGSEVLDISNPCVMNLKESCSSFYMYLQPPNSNMKTLLLLS